MTHLTSGRKAAKGTALLTFPSVFRGGSGRDSAVLTSKVGRKGPEHRFNSLNHSSTRPPQKMQADKAYPTEHNLPTPRSASNQCNECFRQQHIPLPTAELLAPTGHLEWEKAAQHRPKTHSQIPKGQELLEIAVPLSWVLGEQNLPSMQTIKEQQKVRRDE